MAVGRYRPKNSAFPIFAMTAVIALGLRGLSAYADQACLSGERA